VLLLGKRLGSRPRTRPRTRLGGRKRRKKKEDQGNESSSSEEGEPNRREAAIMTKVVGTCLQGRAYTLWLTDLMVAPKSEDGVLVNSDQELFRQLKRKRN
jgi:hypothetical protein